MVKTATITKDQRKKLEEKVEKKIEKKVEDRIEKEVERKMYKRFYNKAHKFSTEFRKHLITAVSAAFGFLIALSWREPIAASVNHLTDALGLGEKVIRYQFLSAAIVTFIAVLALMLVSRWAVKKE